MSAPPEQICRAFEITSQDWRVVKGRLGGTTYLGEQWVLQRRPGSSVHHQLALRQVLKGLPDDPCLAGARFRGQLWAQTRSELLPAGSETEAQWVWSCQPRLQGQLLEGRLDDQQMLQGLQRALPDLARQLGALAELDWTPLAGILPHHGVMVQTAESEWVAQLFARCYPEQRELLERCGPEPEAPLVLAHGDPLLRNLVLGQHCWLVDWEGLYPLPADRDWTHIPAQLSQWVSPEGLRACVDLIWPWAQPCLPGWSQEDFRRAAVWHTAREVALWGGRRAAAVLS